MLNSVIEQKAIEPRTFGELHMNERFGRFSLRLLAYFFASFLFHTCMGSDFSPSSLRFIVFFFFSMLSHDMQEK